MYEPKDPDGQLKWFADTLLQAEKNGETVHVLNHIPPGDSSCQHVWGQEYRKIVNRFAHIITGQFNGHTHNDELRLYYDLENPSIIINVAWNGGSITPYANLNPNYKVYRLDSNTHVRFLIRYSVRRLIRSKQNRISLVFQVIINKVD